MFQELGLVRYLSGMRYQSSRGKNVQRVVHFVVRIAFVAGVGAWVFAQTGNPAEPAILWRDLTAVALMLVPTLVGLGYRDFSKRVDSTAERLDKLHEKFETIEQQLAGLQARLDDSRYGREDRD
jgi:hypothetical protein